MHMCSETNGSLRLPTMLVEAVQLGALLTSELRLYSYSLNRIRKLADGSVLMFSERSFKCIWTIEGRIGSREKLFCSWKTLKNLL